MPNRAGASLVQARERAVLALVAMAWCFSLRQPFDDPVVTVSFCADAFGRA